MYPCQFRLMNPYPCIRMWMEGGCAGGRMYPACGTYRPGLALVLYHTCSLRKTYNRSTTVLCGPAAALRWCADGGVLCLYVCMPVHDAVYWDMAQFEPVLHLYQSDAYYCNMLCSFLFSPCYGQLITNPLSARLSKVYVCIRTATLYSQHSLPAR